MPSRRILFGHPAILAVPLALALGGLPAFAQSQSQPQMQAPADADVGGFSQSQLESYANAVVKIQQIDRAWQPRIQQAENNTEAETLAAQATEQMIGEIQSEGLSVQEYNSITQAAESDRQLYDHITTLLAQR